MQHTSVSSDSSFRQASSILVIRQLNERTTRSALLRKSRAALMSIASTVARSFIYDRDYNKILNNF